MAPESLSFDPSMPSNLKLIRSPLAPSFFPAKKGIFCSISSRICDGGRSFKIPPRSSRPKHLLPSRESSPPVGSPPHRLLLSRCCCSSLRSSSSSKSSHFPLCSSACSPSKDDDDDDDDVPTDDDVNDDDEEECVFPPRTTTTTPKTRNNNEASKKPSSSSSTLLRVVKRLFCLGFFSLINCAGKSLHIKFDISKRFVRTSKR